MTMIQNALAVALLGILACLILLPKAIHWIIAAATFMGAR